MPPRGRPRKSVIPNSPVSNASDSDNATSDGELPPIILPSRNGSFTGRGRPRGRKSLKGQSGGRLNDLLTGHDDKSGTTTRDTTPNNDAEHTDDEDAQDEPPPAKGSIKIVQGKPYKVVNDELQLEEDEKGNTKIDADGNLLGGREYVMHTFTSVHRENPNQRWMLAIEAARAFGFRDSLKFFTRHPLLLKANALHLEKEQLINEGRVHPNLRARGVALISARNTYKIFGAKFVKNGKFIDDDYYEDASRAAGNGQGASAAVVSYDEKEAARQAAKEKEKKEKDPLDRPSIRSLLGANESGRELISGYGFDRAEKTMYGGNGLAPYSKWDSAAKQRKPGASLTETNWCHEYAKAVQEANQRIASWRTESLLEVSLYSGHRKRPLPEKTVEQIQEEEEAKKPKLDSPVMKKEDDMEVDTEPIENGGTPMPPEPERPPVIPPHERKDPKGLMDFQTNVALVPQSTQATSAYWEKIDDRPNLESVHNSRRNQLFTVDFVSLGAPDYSDIPTEDAVAMSHQAYRSPYAFDFDVAGMIRDGVGYSED